MAWILQPVVFKGRTIRKVIGGGGGVRWEKKKTQKNSCKGKCQEKKFMQKEGPIVTFIKYIKFASAYWK